ncbi:hypothetical protein [Paracoccus sp. S3-43]|uniref:hypothetical protein n=1 Tax=Paracoccus sp. S3-43 TaxID=3030011 RepID=UPI0023B14117|nr:hypothetical protein [Paracoccus sp. S3-43]WEF24633.1 hypothetical protein PXD02_01280 [Paracoccus sp. S3-43]
MNRRAFLVAAPTVVAAPGFAAVPEATPIMKLFREWQMLRIEEQRLYDIGAGVTAKDAATARVSAKEDELRAAPATTPLDWTAKVSAIADFGMLSMGEDQDKGLWDEARALIGVPGFMVAS